MALDSTALSSISASLDELTTRIGQLLADGDDDTDDTGELREVERQLQTATRRLTKLVRRLQ